MISPQEYEKQIQEQRLEQAEQKSYLGQDGKIAIVMRNLGQPIMLDSASGGLVDSYYLDDPYDGLETIEDSNSPEELRDRIPMHRVRNPDGSDPSPTGEDAPEDSWEWRDSPEERSYNPTAIGYHFDGLSRGMHLEISYMDDTSIFSVHYKGYEVYKEIRGNLVVYVPISEWEEWIERLFKVAKPLELKKRGQFAQEEAQEIEEEKKSWLQSLRDRWGI